MPPDLHGDDERLAQLATSHVRQRLRGGLALGRTATPAEMDALLARGVQPDGLGADVAWSLFRTAVDDNTVALDSERFLAFIPMAPSTAAVWMDAVVGASSYSAESWLEAAGAVAAENQVLRWLADLAGLPEGAGGCFMSGGTIGNLSALAVARDAHPGRPLVAVADTAHASVANALHLLGLSTLTVPTGPDARFTAAALTAALNGLDDPTRVGIVVASAGSTNAGVVDDLLGLGAVAREVGAWLHIDAAYGGAALLLDEERGRFAGIESADSLIVDPHKWLFATGGSCALLYRDPSLARAVHTQHGPYIDILRGDGWWNPSDVGFQLTRRASGLPLWFSLMVHGVDAHAVAVRRGIELARRAAEMIDASPVAELVTEPGLSVVLFRRHGWTAGDWAAWAAQLLRDGIAFVAPTTWKGEAVGRLVFLHPGTTDDVIREIVDSLDAVN
jgi:aromatic-L-amino-acid/L-tryptophan decarboxylase